MKIKPSFNLIPFVLVCINFSCFAAEPMECVRAQPVPVIETNTNVKNYSFLKTSQQEAKELFILPSGIPVKIFHSGCEDFALELHFSVSDEGHALSNATYWLQKTSSLLAEVKNIGATNHISDIQRGIFQALKVGGYKYTQPIETIEGYEFTYFKVVWASENKYDLVITYAVAL